MNHKSSSKWFSERFRRSIPLLRSNSGTRITQCVMRPQASARWCAVKWKPVESILLLPFIRETHFAYFALAIAHATPHIATTRPLCNSSYCFDRTDSYGIINCCLFWALIWEEDSFNSVDHRSHSPSPLFAQAVKIANWVFCLPRFFLVGFVCFGYGTCPTAVIDASKSNCIQRIFCRRILCIWACMCVCVYMYTCVCICVCVELSRQWHFDGAVNGMLVWPSVLIECDESASASVSACENSTGTLPLVNHHLNDRFWQADEQGPFSPELKHNRPQKHQSILIFSEIFPVYLKSLRFRVKKTTIDHSSEMSPLRLRKSLTIIRSGSWNISKSKKGQQRTIGCSSQSTEFHKLQQTSPRRNASHLSFTSMGWPPSSIRSILLNRHCIESRFNFLINFSIQTNSFQIFENWKSIEWRFNPTTVGLQEQPSIDTWPIASPLCWPSYRPRCDGGSLPPEICKTSTLIVNRVRFARAIIQSS